MRIIDGFKVRSLGREFILTSERVSMVSFNKMISLNESAAYLWEALQGKDFTVDDMVNLLLERYAVDREQAFQDCTALSQKWIEAEIVEP